MKWRVRGKGTTPATLDAHTFPVMPNKGNEARAPVVVGSTRVSVVKQGTQFCFV